MDDGFPWHKNNAGLSDAAFRLHIHGIAYCNRELTDGRIEADEIPVLVRKYKPRALAELLLTGHWFSVLAGTQYEIRDYLQWNASKETVMQRRAHTAKRQAAFRGTR